MVVEQATSILHRRPRACGFFLGTAVIVIAFLLGLESLADPADQTGEGLGDGVAGVGRFPALFVIAAIGYLAAVAAAKRRRTRQVGEGMLVGLTVMFPVAWAALMVTSS